MFQINNMLSHSYSYSVLVYIKRIVSYLLTTLGRWCLLAVKVIQTDYYRENNQIYARLDRSTIFHFLSRDGKELVNLPFMIQSDNKIPIDFDKSGRFRSSSNMSNRTTSSYRPCIFYPHQAINLRETSL
ncbi:hypothetical protein KUTeg_021546 [Tegillarca granosa]|uniref:Uncharacterized protein n=1 Tax=Tegillarca granosa TaxID=220873 RepID=A0ABQ9E8Z4_TEGGR|nr:hypothetical protein KUTeg_021546 [Tegillarca granosa]